MTATPVRYTADVETPTDEEAVTTARLNDVFDTILETVAENSGHAVRSVHAKSHGILEGTLTIDAGLPPELAQGLFATPGTHKVFMRLSTNAGDILPDAISLPRGVALKVTGVAGERLPDAEGDTQDFVMVNGKVFTAKTTQQFLHSLKLLAKTTDRIEGVKTAASAVLRGVNTALQAVVSPGLTALTGTKIDTSGRPDAIRETVRSQMRDLDAQWEFRVQLCRDLEAQPIEDSTVEWGEDDAPFQRVGLVYVAPQDSWAAAHVAAVDEGMRFSVWTGLAAHQPLGNINRARKSTYRHSASFRAAFNKCPIHEPTA